MTKAQKDEVIAEVSSYLSGFGIQPNQYSKGFDVVVEDEQGGQVNLTMIRKKTGATIVFTGILYAADGDVLQMNYPELQFVT